MRHFLPFLFILFTVTLQAQQHMALYDGPVPNNKPNAGQRDSSVFYKKGTAEWEFMLQVATPDLAVYLPKKTSGKIAAVIICPGGGYFGLAMAHEGRDIAKRLQEAGMAAFVLKYRLPNPNFVDNKEIVPLQDAQRAMQLVRENAAKWGIDPHRIGILGSSAGGHLASTVGTHWQTAQIPNPKKTSLRPDFMILNYPVISFADSLTHYGSRYFLSGPVLSPDASKEKSDGEKGMQNIPIPTEAIQNYSNELQVKPDTPPTFITAAVDDDVVKVQNTLVFIAALQKNKVPVQSFFYAKGGHGYGMDNPTSDVDWMDSCLVWLRKSGFTK